MPTRYFNWKLAIVLIISICVLGVTAVGLRQWQRTHRADQGLILGNKAYDEQNWDEAAKYFGRYIAIEKVDVPILMKYAEAQLKIRPSKRVNIGQALNAYRSVLRTDKSNYKAAILLTKLYLDIFELGEAELVASKYLKNNDDPEPEIREMLALAMARQRKFTEAAAELKAIIQEHPDQISAYEMLGKLTVQHPEAFQDPDDHSPEHWFNEAVEKNSSSALAHIARAGFYLYQRNKDSSKTIADLESAALRDLGEATKILDELKIQDPNVELRLAVEFMNANIQDKAEKYLTSVQTSIPKDLRVWETWAELSIVFNFSEKRMREIAETGLIELSYQSLDFMPTATELFIRSGQFKRADECISEMKQKDVAPMAVTFLKGLLAAEKREYPNAINYWQESIRSGNTSPQVRLMLSSALSRVGDTQSALRHLRTLVSENPDFVTGHLALAKLYADTRNWAESARSAAMAKQISPDNSEASLLYLQAQLKLRAAGSADENVLTFQEIEKQLSELKEAENNLPEFKLLKFQLALKQDNFTDAENLVTQLKKLVTKLKKDNPLQIKTTMAEVGLLVAQDKTDEAISIYLDALDEFPQTIELVGYLAGLLDQKGDNEKCEEIIQEALKHIHQSDNQRELGLLLAKYYDQWNQNDKLYSHLNTLVQQRPEDILLKRWLLSCERIINDSTKAQQLVDDIKQLEGDEGWQWRYEQARIWSLSEHFEARYAEILSLLQYNIKENPNDRESRILLAAVYSQADELQMAISTYREALNRSPDDIRIIVPLINILSRLMEFDEVDQLLRRVGDSEQDLYKEQLQQFQLQSHLRHGQLSSASDILQDFISSDPNDQAKLFVLASLKAKQGKYDEAKELLDELKIKDPNSLTIATAQVQINLNQNKTAEALRVCDEIVNNLNNAAAYIFRARTNIALKQIDKAIEDYEYAAAIEPNNVNVWMAKSAFYRFIGQLDKAIADFEHAAAVEPNNVEIWVAKSAFYRSIGQLDKAIADFEHATAVKPNNVEILVARSAFYRSIGQLDKAIADFEQAAAVEPNNVEIWVAKSAFYRSIGQLDKAVTNMQTALSLASDDIQIQKQVIKLLLESGDIKKVLQGKADLAKALKSKPDDIDLQLLKANSLLMENTAPAIEKATEILKKITEDQPEISMAWVLLGNLSVKGQPEKAMEIAFRGLTHSPNDMALLLLKARAEKNRAPALAIPTLKALLEADPNNTEVVLLLAETYCEAGEPEKAVNFLKSQLASRGGTPGERIIKIGLAVALYKNGSSANAQEEFDSLILSEKDSFTLINIANKLPLINDSQARKTSERILKEKVLSQDPDSVRAMTVLCKILQISGRSDESIPYYRRMLGIQPENKEILNNLAWLLSEDKSKLPEALELANKGLDIDPNYVDLIDTRGLIFYKMGELDKALDDFTQCIKLYPKNLKCIPAAIGSRIRLAKTFAELGQRNKAVEHLNQALDMNRALDPQSRIGVLTTSDIDEAQQLLRQLQEGN